MGFSQRSSPDLGIAIATAIIMRDFRERDLHKTARELENTVQPLVKHFDRQIGDFESIEKSLAIEIETRVKTGEEFKRILSSEDVHHLLRNKISNSDDFAGVNLFDSDGNYTNASERWPAPSLNLADRNYFQAFRTGTNDGPVLIELAGC